jgi:plasmid stability protein
VPSLQVRNLPEHIYRRIAESAHAERRSIAQETVVLLEKALNMETKKKTARQELIDRILKKPPADPRKIPDPVHLIREDRRR